MNILTIPSVDPQDVVHLKYANQSERNQKKLLDFLVDKNISFYPANQNQKNYEALIQIYNIKSNKKPKSLSKSPSRKDTSSKSPLNTTKNLSQTPKKTMNSSPNFQNSLKKEDQKSHKKEKTIENSKDSSDLQNNKNNKKNNENKEKVKKKAVSIHNNSNSKTQTIGKTNLFLEELNKNFQKKDSKTSLNDHSFNKKESQINEKNKRNSKDNDNIKKNSQTMEQTRRISKENIKEENKKEITKKKSFKNDSSMKILQKNREILDNLINSRSIVEFDATKSKELEKKSFDINSKTSKKSEAHEDNLLNTKEKKSIGGFEQKNELKKKESITKNKKNSQKTPKKGSFIEKTKENISERNTQISEKIENDFKQIMTKEFSRVPSGEKLNKNSINMQFQKAVQILYERLDLLSSEELIFYYKFIVNKAKKLYLDFLQKRGLIVN